MADPKLNALVFCVKAVFTDPWWNLIGVFQEYYLRSESVVRFDAYIKIGDAAIGEDIQISLSITEPENGLRLGGTGIVTRAAEDGTLDAALALELQGLREGTYTVEVWMGAHILDAQKLRVIDLG